MNDLTDQLDREWGIILTRCHGTIDFRGEFKSALLAKLKDKLRENAAVPESPGTDEEWRRLLKGAYIPCRPGQEFKHRLREAMLIRQRELAAAGLGEAETVAAALSGINGPVAPRPEFASRLLANLKERQRDVGSRRRRSRLHTGFLSLASGLAAAALVMFVINPPAVVTGPASSAAPVLTPDIIDLEPIPEPARPQFVPAPTLAADGNLQVDDLFRQSPLPGGVRGLGMEMNDGGGWLAMDPARTIPVKPGMSFRPVLAVSGSEGAVGLDFDGGSAISVRGDSLLTASPEGFRLQRGVMSVNVPDEAPEGLRLHFPERDVAVRPGTFLAVSTEAAEQYAEGGAPAPKITVADGGMAIARGRNGSGALFANHIYSIDNYVSPDLPGRSLCNAECDELEKSRPAARVGQPGRFASLGGPAAAGRPGLARPAANHAGLPTYGFSKRDSRWVADSFKGQPTVRIKYLSDAYFGLADSRRDLATALGLGPEVVIDGGDGRFYEIY